MTILRKSGQLDVLNYYKVVAPKLEKFLAGKELATRIWLPGMGRPLLKRGSKEKPLYIEDLINGLTDEFLETRVKLKKLDTARGKLAPVQELVWEYFYPRKLCDFFYATNREGEGRNMDRIFYDIDRGNLPLASALEVARELLAATKDKEFAELIGSHKRFVMYTGYSFHVYLLLKKEITPLFYDKYIHFTENDPAASFTGRWAAKISEETKIKVIGGHEKQAGHINIDPSQTPSGKLARAPYSLHMKNATTVDGVAIPVTEKELAEPDILAKLKAYTPDKIVAEFRKK
ncbi:MAG: hypothetical protein ABIF92_01260 [archaeon]